MATRGGRYAVAGDQLERRHETARQALSLAITLATRHEDDGEEYRHGVLDTRGNQVVGRAIRHADGSITALLVEREKEE